MVFFLLCLFTDSCQPPHSEHSLSLLRHLWSCPAGESTVRSPGRLRSDGQIFRHFAGNSGKNQDKYWSSFFQSCLVQRIFASRCRPFSPSSLSGEFLDTADNRLSTWQHLRTIHPLVSANVRQLFTLSRLDLRFCAKLQRPVIWRQ